MEQRESTSSEVHSNIVSVVPSGKIHSSTASTASGELSTPYATVCRHRIKNMKKLQDEQFKTEIKNLEAMQQSAYDQIRFHRFFAITTLWPPLHNRSEIERTMRCCYGNSPKHFQRINFILENALT